MEYRLWLARTRGSVSLADLSKYKSRWTALLCVGVVACAGAVLSRPAILPNLAKATAANLIDFKAHWAKGDMIVLVRHAERCDHSSAPCLGPLDGITERGKSAVQNMGLQFQKLGMQNADIYSSPLTRAAQTSGFMFNYASVDQGWLFNCKKTMLTDTLSHKVKGRNLVLVTHSECFAALEKLMDLPASKTRDYGYSLFLTASNDGGRPVVTGFVDATDWQSVVGK
jgi:phosphohistidine phosphatase SixA